MNEKDLNVPSVKQIDLELHDQGNNENQSDNTPHRAESLQQFGKKSLQVSGAGTSLNNARTSLEPMQAGFW